MAAASGGTWVLWCLSLVLQRGEQRVAHAKEEMRGGLNKGGKKKRESMRFLNLLMFVDCHNTDEHKRITPRVPCPLMSVSSATSPMNISVQCHVKYRPVVCSSVTCQTDKRKVCSSALKTGKHNLHYLHRP
jgi:hypothetical protein